MAIGHVPPIPKRTTQGSKLSSYQHDNNIHEVLRQTINALIDEVNALSSATSGLGAGVSLEWNSNTLPTTFNALWENGVVVSRTTYASLFSVIGTSFNTGGETGSQFRLPNSMGKVTVCANPLNGQTDVALSTRTFATYIGLETNSYTPTITVNTVTLSATPSGTVTLSPYTPSGTISIPNVTATGTIVVSTVTPSGTIAVDTTNIAYTPAGTISVTLTNGSVAGTGTSAISGASCVEAQAQEGGLSVMECTSPLVADISGIAAGLTTAVSVNTQTFTGSATNFNHTHTATFTGAGVVPTATFTGTPISVSGTFTGSASGQTASFAGVLMNLNHSHTASSSAIVASTIQPGVVKNKIITY